MTDFKIIETQEAFDAAIKDRLQRQKDSIEKEYAALKTRNAELESEVSSLQTVVEETKKSAGEYDQKISELTAKVEGYETANLRTKIALQNGLPFDLADRLVGTDEESLKADAERLAGFVKSKAPVPPLKNTEPPVGDSKDEALKQMLKNMSNEGE